MHWLSWESLVSHSGLTVLSAEIQTHFGSCSLLPSLSSTARALLAARSSSPVTAGLCHPKIPAERFYYKEVGRHRHNREGKVRGSQNTLPGHTVSPALFPVMSLPLCLATYPGKWDLTRDRTQSSEQISSSEPLISQHSMSGYEEPGVPILLEMAGFELLVCKPRQESVPRGWDIASIPLPWHCPPADQLLAYLLLLTRRRTEPFWILASLRVSCSSSCLEL